MIIKQVKALLSFLLIVLIHTQNIAASPLPESNSREEAGNDTLIRFTQQFKIDSDVVVVSPSLERFSQEVDSIMRVDTINSVEITGVASIDGPEALNNRLAKARALAMEKWLASTTKVPDSIISTQAKGEDWEWFHALVKSNPQIPAQQKIIEILNSSLSNNQKERSIKSLDKGLTWNYLAKNIFPIMRCAQVDLGVKHRYIVPLDNEKIVEIEEIEEVIIEEPQVIEEERVEPQYVEDYWQRRFYIKTDLPYWLMTWANLAFEVDLAPHWSFNLPIYLSTVNYFKHTIKFRTFSFQPGFRYWLRSNNTGVYFEAHYGMGWWNFAFNGRYRYQDHFRKSPTMGGGIAAGYRLPISSNGRWAMEFGGGVGVYRLTYDRFQNKYNGKLIDSHKKTVFFIDNINVSISYSFPIEKKKGGIK